MTIELVEDKQGVRVSAGIANGYFAGRAGGTSPAPWESLNIGYNTADLSERVSANRSTLVSLATGQEIETVAVQQVHGARVVTAEAANNQVEADGLWMSFPGVCALVQTADCLPVMIANASSVAMLHAGWRGLSAGILGAGVASLRSVDSSEIVAVLGPCAGACCYQVGDLVRDAFDEQAVFAGDKLDLQATAALMLLAAGVVEVAKIERCTICDPERRYFSHRATNGTTGRQGSVAWLNR
ncbi:MAG: polyphenol oxidase family protein [Solirubrobacterales bacterium]|nr:polyphenol oxidase family protein [Solirubrobacterales bacterium]